MRVPTLSASYTPVSETSFAFELEITDKSNILKENMTL